MSVTRRPLRLASLAALAACCIVLVAMAPQVAPAQTVDPRFWGTDGSVNSIAVSDHVVYLGGLFSSVAPVTGGGVLLSATSGAPRETFAKVDGAVYAVVSDGAGGWFITGQFRHAGGLAHDNLAHVLADGSVADWNPRLHNVYDEPSGMYGWAIACAGRIVYVGGFFLHANGVPRIDLAAFDAVTGELKPWDPEPSNFVTSLTVADSTLYVGGRFYRIAGQHRGYIAAFDAASGALRDWSPEANSDVNAIAVRADIIYAGGEFTSIGGAARRYLAALDAGSGAALAWDPSPSGTVKALAAGPGAIFAAGEFDSIGGAPRHLLGAVDPVTGQATSWTTSVDFHGVEGLALRGDALYAAGGVVAAGLDAGSGATRWSTALRGTGRPIAVGDNAHEGGPRGKHRGHTQRPVAEVYLGGDFNSIGERIPRVNLAAFDLRTGGVLEWNPGSDGPVYALAIADNRVWLGGSFTKIHGEGHRGLAAVDRARGVPERDAPETDGSVLALAVRGERLYAGGRFAHLGGAARSNIASWDARRGTLAAWDPGANDAVSSLAIEDDALYAGGAFTLAGGGGTGTVPRGYSAAFDSRSGRLLAWDPRADAAVSALLATDSCVYLGGLFEQVGTEPRYAIASVDPVTGAPRPWNPHVSRYNNRQFVEALATAGGYVYMAGGFNFLVSDWRQGFGAVDASTGALSPWNPWQVGRAITMERDGDVLFVGGGFKAVGGYPCDNFAVLNVGRRPHREMDAPPKAAPPQRAQAESARLALTCGPNPVRSSGVIRLELPAPGRVTVALFDLAGRRVRSLLDSEWLAVGSHQVPFDARGLAPGLYLCRLETPGRLVVTRVVVTE
jgi:hypothetical protein